MDVEELWHVVQREKTLYSIVTSHRPTKIVKCVPLSKHIEMGVLSRLKTAEMSSSYQRGAVCG